MAGKRADKIAVHENQPGETDDTMDVTLDDGTVITDTPTKIIERAMAGEFLMPSPDVAAEVVDAHNGAVLDPTKDTGDAELVAPEDVPVATPIAEPVKLDTGTTELPDARPPGEGATTGGNTASALPPGSGNESADPVVTTTPEMPEPPTPAAGVRNTDTSLPSAGLTAAPGGSTQTDSATTVSGDPTITDDNPVVQEIPTTVQTAPTPADVTKIAPAPDANAQISDAATTENASKADAVSNASPAVVSQAPRAQPGSEAETTGEQAVTKAAETSPSTWTPSSPLAPQLPTTLEEHAAQEAAAAAPPPKTVEERLKALEDRIDAVEHQADELDTDLTQVEARLDRVEKGN